MTRKSQRSWMISTVILAVLLIGTGVFSVLAIVKNGQNSSKISELQDGIELKDDTIAVLQKKNNALRKSLGALEDEEEAIDNLPDTSEGYDESYYMRYGEYLNAVTYTATADRYIYIPEIGKRVQLPASVDNVLYTRDRSSIMVWATAAGTSGRTYANPVTAKVPLLRISLFSSDYIGKYREFWSQDPNALESLTPVITENSIAIVIDSRYETCQGGDATCAEEQQVHNDLVQTFSNSANYRNM